MWQTTIVVLHAYSHYIIPSFPNSDYLPPTNPPTTNQSPIYSPRKKKKMPVFINFEDTDGANISDEEPLICYNCYGPVDHLLFDCRVCDRIYCLRCSENHMRNMVCNRCRQICSDCGYGPEGKRKRNHRNQCYYCKHMICDHCVTTVYVDTRHSCCTVCAISFLKKRKKSCRTGIGRKNKKRIDMILRTRKRSVQKGETAHHYY